MRSESRRHEARQRRGPKLAVVSRRADGAASAEGGASYGLLVGTARAGDESIRVDGRGRDEASWFKDVAGLYAESGW